MGAPPPALVILAAGVGSRFGGPKQLSPIGPCGETLLDYAIYDALRAGFSRAVLVIRKELAASLKQHVSEVTGGAVPVQYVEQRLDEGRVKPWGTGHAVLAARDALEGPFAVCNADDFYGPGAYRLLAEHLTGRTVPPDGPAVLEEQFAVFLAAHRAPDAEFLLSTALDEQVTASRARLRVLTAPPSDHWLGMTFAADVPAVRAAIGALVRAGTYPADLRAAFTPLFGY